MISADRTVAQVHRLLVSAGARQIMTTYDDGTATGVAFSVETAHGDRSFLLPINADRVEDVLQRQKVERRYQTPEQAERVAWRIIKDWLEAQLAIIRTEMVTLDQVMLSYMVNGDGRTMWELYQTRQLALPEGGEG